MIYYLVNMKGFSRATSAIDVSIIKRVELMARAHGDVISLAQGIPSFNTAAHIKQAARKAIDADLVGKYTVGYGIPELREAIAKKVTAQNGIPTNFDEVIVTHGGLEALMAIFLALLNPEDDIIIPTPDYASHLTQVMITKQGGRAIEVPLQETDTEWKLDPEALEKAITPKSKAILICNPSNPIGKVYSEEELKQIAQIALKHDLYIVVDEMYEHFTFDGKNHISIGSFPEVADRTISVFGVSKSYAMTGWRIGYIVAKRNLIDEIFKIHDSLITCPTAVSQYATLEAITGPQDVVAEYKKEFEKRRAITMEELAKTDKLATIMPQGAYYAFPKILKPVDDVEFCIKLVKEAKVAVVPGTPFGKGGESHVRISFGLEEDVLREGLQRLVRYLNVSF